MADGTGIEWTDASWNPVRGCTRVSPGCGGPNHEGGCYAEKVAARFSGPSQPYEGFAERTPHGGRWTGKLALIEKQLDLPLHWRRPRNIFVNSMSDLFHENLPDEAIDRVFAVMLQAPQHTFQVLTKRLKRMREYLSDPETAGRVLDESGRYQSDVDDGERDTMPWPLPNVWVGASIEDQQRANERMPELAATPAALRFISAEPLLGAVDLSQWLAVQRINLQGRAHWTEVTGKVPSIGWVIVGGESGPGARPMELQWVRDVLAQCRAADVAAFIKQLGSHQAMARVGMAMQPRLRNKKGGDPAEWPEDLRVREVPERVAA